MKLIRHKNLSQIAGGIVGAEVNEEAQAIVRKLKAIYQLTEELTEQLDVFEDDVFAAMRHRKNR